MPRRMTGRVRHPDARQDLSIVPERPKTGRRTRSSTPALPPGAPSPPTARRPKRQLSNLIGPLARIRARQQTDLTQAARPPTN
jgi:hypothetical protein